MPETLMLETRRSEGFQKRQESGYSPLFYEGQERRKHIPGGKRECPEMTRRNV